MTAIDRAALEAARTRPVIVALGQIIGAIAGGPSAASNASNYYNQAGDTSTGAYNDAGGVSNKAYTNAGKNIGGYYQDAMGNVINATGSPAATTFGNMEQAALQPKFNMQDKQLMAQLAANGITGSGAGKADFSDLAANQSATLSGAIAPLYDQALSSYDSLNAQGAAARSGNSEAQAGSAANIAASGAGARSGIAQQGAGAANNAYNQSIQDFYGAIGAAGGAFGGQGGAAANPYGSTSGGNYYDGYQEPLNIPSVDNGAYGGTFPQ